MKLNSGLLTTLLILAATSTQAETTLFKDNYNITGGSSIDLNIETANRQAGGTTTADYAYVGISNGNDILDNEFRTRANATKLNANFAAELGANNFTLSIDGRHASDEAWVSFSMISAEQNGRGATDLTFRIIHNDVISIGSNSAPNGKTITLTKAKIQALDNSLSNWSSSDSYTYAFVATATSALAGTFDFTINGIVAAAGISYSFTDTTVRSFDWSNVGRNAIGMWDNTTLTIQTPTP
ncbi:hypothetical protein ACWPKO_15195 [Coraliomargarita sp. W4R53]